MVVPSGPKRVQTSPWGSVTVLFTVLWMLPTCWVLCTLGVQGLGLNSGLGFRVEGLGFRV